MTSPIAWLPDDYDQVAARKFGRPFHTFLLKIASLCNLDCSYCYVYQSPDTSWKWKPKYLDQEVTRRIAGRIQEHVAKHALKEVTIVFHGGEPLLVGLGGLRELVATLSSIIQCRIHWGMQTNGTLLDESIMQFFFDHSFRVGLSLDGTRAHNDRHRLYRNGDSSYDKAVRAIQLLTSCSDWRKVFGGILVVIDVDNRPGDVLDAIVGLGVHSANLLLPDGHYEAPPPKVCSGTPVYGRWLCEFFDLWCQKYPELEIPYFDQIIALMLGGISTAEEIGAQSVDLIVVETNGDIEAVDTLKIVGRRATSLGMNVASHTFDDALRHPAIYSRMSGFHALSKTCRECRHLQACGGGYIPHRYSSENGFVNPSIYCEDLKHLFLHIEQTFLDERSRWMRGALDLTLRRSRRTEAPST
jgi:uncharacterized protein